jgi:hypothetical protein
LAIGAGVGIPLGLLAIGSLVLLFKQDQRKRIHRLDDSRSVEIFSENAKALIVEMDSSVKPAELHGEDKK